MTQEIQGDSLEVLAKAALCFGAARHKFVEGSGYLYEIQEKKLWEGTYSSFGEFVETACGISQSFASKLLKVYTYYHVEHGLSPRKLQEIDTEKAYLAISLNGEAEHKLLKAAEWNRQEIKDELASGPNGDCKHQVLIIKHQCKACSRFIDVN